jgi:hypothetical protein
MAHFHYDNTNYSQMIIQSMGGLETGLDGLNRTLGTMALMLTGDGTQAAHFSEITLRYGFVNDAESQAAYNELQSLAFKLNTNASVTDVHNALIQAFNKFRVGV